MWALQGALPLRHGLDDIEGLFKDTGNAASSTCSPLPAPLTVDALSALQALDTTPFVRGDFDSNGSIDGLTDTIYLLSYLFQGGNSLACEAAADFNADGTIQLVDAIALLHFSFLGGTAPAPPYPECGFDITTASLGCLSSTCP